MANEIKNPKIDANFPGRFNKRENRCMTHNYSLLACDSDYASRDDDGVNYVRVNASAAAVEFTFPPATAGRCFTFYVADATNAVTVAANADGAAITGTAPSLAGEWTEYYCDGSSWLIVKSNV